jgi:hypothetical protein
MVEVSYQDVGFDQTSGKPLPATLPAWVWTAADCLMAAGGPDRSETRRDECERLSARQPVRFEVAMV